MSKFHLSNEAIQRNELIDKFQNPQCGAFISFEGWVRNHHQSKPVSHLIYETYAELSLHEGNLVIAQALEKFDIQSAYCSHRIGHLHIGDMAIWIGVNAAHRDAAFKACRYIIDTIKENVPIFKKEFYTDNTPEEWINPKQ